MRVIAFDEHIITNAESLSGIKLYYSTEEPEIIRPLLTINDSVKDTFENGVITRRVGVVDLGALEWTYQAGQKRARAVPPADIYWNKATGTPSNIRCDGYTTVSFDFIYENFSFDKLIASGGSSACYLYVRNLACESSEAYKSAMQGVMLYYELAEPYTEQSSIEPTSYIDKDGRAMKNGDTWYQTNTDSENAIDSLYVWNGSEWSESAYDGSMISDNSITSQEIANNTITSDNIADNSLSIINMDDSIMASSGLHGSMSWSDDALHIVSKNSDLTETYETEIGGDGIKFKYQDNVVASIDQDQLVIDKTLVFTEMKIGNWSWAINEKNGNLMVKWGGN